MLQVALPYAILVIVGLVWFQLIGFRSPLTILSMCTVIFALSWLVSAWLWRVTWRPRVVRSLRELGYDVCPKCGDWLKGLDESIRRCSECGAPRATQPVPPP